MGVEYGWVFSTGAERERLFGVFREACENAVALNCGLMMSAIGPDEASTDEAVANIRRAGEIAGGYRPAAHRRIPVPASGGAQPRHPARADRARRGANVGLLLDAYHLQRGGRPGRGFAEVPGAEIFYVQFSDVPDAPPPSLPPVDRLPPGKGVVGWTGLFRLLAEKGYDG